MSDDPHLSSTIGRYYEPYYLVFAPQLDNAESSNSTEKPPPLQIVHHSIPHWLPLRELSQKYLGVSIRGADDEPVEDSVELLSQKTVQPDLDVSPPFYLLSISVQYLLRFFGTAALSLAPHRLPQRPPLAPRTTHLPPRGLLSLLLHLDGLPRLRQRVE